MWYFFKIGYGQISIFQNLTSLANPIIAYVNMLIHLCIQGE